MDDDGKIKFSDNCDGNASQRQGSWNSQDKIGKERIKVRKSIQVYQQERIKTGNPKGDAKRLGRYVFQCFHDDPRQGIPCAIKQMVMLNNSALKLIYEFLKSEFENSKTKVNADATTLVGEVMRVLVIEGAMRASHQAKIEGCDTVTLEHLEKILSQLLLDFS